MAIKFRCPLCQQFLGIADHKAGSLTECPGCASSIIVPLPDDNQILQPEPVAIENPQDITTNGFATSVVTTGQRFPAANGTRTLKREPFGQQAIPAETISSEVHVPTEVISGPLVTSRTSTLNSNLLKELKSIADTGADTPVTDRPNRSAGRSYHIGPALLLFVALMTSIAGGAIGYSAKGRSIAAPVAATNQKVQDTSPKKAVQPVAEVAQTSAIPIVVTYADKAGVKKPDRGARVLLLPIIRNGTVKIAGNGFRVGADETDRRLVEAAAEVFGGVCGRADDAGTMTVNAPKHGRFGLLVASRYQLRTSSEPLTDEARRFLETYFEQPEFVVGNVRYEFREIVIDASSNYAREIHFPLQ